MTGRLMPGADEAAFRTITGETINPSTPWKLPDLKALLATAHRKANDRRFTGEPPTVFQDLPDDEE